QQLPDWIELHNPATNAVNLSGMSLTDSVSTPRKWIFPDGSLVGAAGYLVIECNAEVSVSPTNTGFSLKAGGDGAYIFDRPENGGGLLDSVTFGLQTTGFSIGRIPNATGPWHLNVPTRSSPNIAMALGNTAQLKINEWLANPASGDDWFEVYNLGD